MKSRSWLHISVIVFSITVVAIYIFFRIHGLNRASLTVKPENNLRPPNVVLIIVDTLRADYVYTIGGLGQVTPAIDKLGELGAVFTDCISSAPVTGPAITSIMTGKYPPTSGVRFNLTAPSNELITLAEQFSSMGYETAGFVSSTIIHRRFGYNQGFQHFDDDLSREYSPNHYERDAKDTVDAVIDWLGSHDKSKPLFLFVHLFDPHAPYIKHFGDDAGDSYASDFLDDLYMYQDVETIEKERNRIIEFYASEVYYTDNQIGRLLNGLSKSDIFKDSIVVLMADHGEELFFHDNYAQHGRSLFNTVLNVPLVISAPGRIIPGTRIDLTVRSVDVFPTLVEFAGGDPPEDIDGKSLVPVLNGEEKESRRALSFRAPHDFFWEGIGKSLNHGDWKYISFTDNDDRLFNLDEDPLEKVTVAKDNPGRSESMRKFILDFDPSHVKHSAPTISDDDKRMLKDLGYIQ